MQRPRRVQGAERVAGAQAGPLHHVVVRAAEEPVLPQRELSPGDKLAAAGHAAETLDVVDAVPRPHHQIAAAEAHLALGALDAEEPDVVPLAVGLPVSHEARARLVQVLAALGALEAGGVPLEVWRHPQDKLIVDLTPAAHAHGRPGLLCRGRARSPRQAWLPGTRPRPLQPQPNPLALSFKNWDHKFKRKWALQRSR